MLTENELVIDNGDETFDYTRPGQEDDLNGSDLDVDGADIDDMLI